jgi:hypothetical protein
VRLPCGRHGVSTAKTISPNDVITNHCVEHSDHLAHHRYDHNLRHFAGGFQAIVEGSEQGIPMTGAQRRHVEDLADVRTTSPDAAPSLERATLEGVGRDADQRSDLFAVHAAELRQQRNQRTGQHRSDTRHGNEQSVAVGKRAVGRNDLDHALVEQVDVGSEPPDAAPRKTLQHRIFQQSGGILGGDFLRAELAADGEHLGQPFDRPRRLRPYTPV